MQPDAGVFTSYVAEYKSCRDAARKLIARMGNMRASGRRNDVEKKIEKKIRQMNVILNNMEHESGGYRGGYGRLLKIHSTYEGECTKLKRNFADVRKKCEEMSDLFYAEDENERFENEDNRKRLLRTTAMAENQQKTIDRSLRVLGHVDDLTDHTMVTLVGQRNQIEVQIRNVGIIQAEGSRGGLIISRITKRQLTGKIVLVLIILLLLLGIAVVGYFGILHPIIKAFWPKTERQVVSVANRLLEQLNR